jgi:hypothetical protein
MGQRECKGDESGWIRCATTFDKSLNSEMTLSGSVTTCDDALSFLPFDKEDVAHHNFTEYPDKTW